MWHNTFSQITFLRHLKDLLNEDLDYDAVHIPYLEARPLDVADGAGVTGPALARALRLAPGIRALAMMKIIHTIHVNHFIIVVEYTKQAYHQRDVIETFARSLSLSLSTTR